MKGPARSRSASASASADEPRHALVLNHFAAPRGAPGGTRHVELFGRLPGWTATIVAARRNLLTGREASDLGDLTGVWTSPYTSNGLTRVLNWLSYGVTAFVAGLRALPPDVVYGSSPHLVAAAAGWALARLRRAAFVLEVRDLWPRVLVEMGQFPAGSPVVTALEAVEWFLYARADLIVVLADGVRRTLVAEGVDATRIVVIPNGADPEDFVPPAPRPELRERYGLAGVVVAYTGAHGPANGLDLLLDAASELANTEPDVRVLLVGDGPRKRALVDRARREGLANVVFREPVPKAEMAALLGAVDIGVHVLADVPLFRYGVSPNKLFDYMAAGLPVVTNTGGEVGDLVTEAGAGEAVAPDGLADGIRRLVRAGPDGRRARGANGRGFMARERSRSALARRLGAALLPLVDRAG